MKIDGKKILVIGMGKSGVAAASLLLRKGGNVFVYDSIEEKTFRKAIEKKVKVKWFEKEQTKMCFDFAIVSPGVHPQTEIVQEVKKAKIPIWSEMELGSRFLKCPIIGITGTNGKTTTTELIAGALKHHGKKVVVGGNIGVPLCDLVEESEKLDWISLEVSSFQLENTEQFHPNIAVLLNIAEDHLDRYESMEEYARTKERIFEKQTSKDSMVVGSKYLIGLKTKSQKIVFSSKENVRADYTVHQGWICRKGEKVFRQAQTRLAGKHNAENLLAAFAVAHLCGVSDEEVEEAFSAYTPLAHRCEKVGTSHGVLYINDSKATNLDAMEKAILSVNAPVVLIAGGKDKGLNVETYSKLIEERVKAVVFIGEMKSKMEQAWGNATTCFSENTLDDAVERTQKLADSGDVVLFSPGCSSFDMFENYEQRGESFKKSVLSRMVDADPAEDNN